MEYSEQMQKYNHNCKSVLQDCTYFPQLCISQLLSQNVSEIFLFIMDGVIVILIFSQLIMHRLNELENLSEASYFLVILTFAGMAK
jgi:hypothetical protein